MPVGLSRPTTLLQVNYKEDQSSFNDKLPGEKADRKVKYIDREDIDLSGYAAPKQRSAVDSGKGVRVQASKSDWSSQKIEINSENPVL